MNDLYEKERREKSMLTAMQRHDAGIGGTIGMEPVDTCCNKAETTRPATSEEMQDSIIRRTVKRLDYHPPVGDQSKRYLALRDAAKAFAIVILRNAPPYSDETRAAIQCIETALMIANKSIALEND